MRICGMQLNPLEVTVIQNPGEEQHKHLIEAPDADCSDDGPRWDDCVAEDGHDAILYDVAVLSAVCLCDAVLVGDLAIVPN